MRDTVGAFCPHGHFELAGGPGGPLAGLTFAVKDLYDIEGHVTGAGNPDWLKTHRPASRTAPPVTALLAAGARMIGKTITDELAYSLNGDNIHYGTPKNSRAPGRVPGGSSSGSAAAVAASLCDFALGTDTGGSVRIPASFCGLFGIRTTQDAISTEGLVPLMPSFDTVGWFTRDIDTSIAVGTVLLPENAMPENAMPELGRFMIGSDALAIADPDAKPPLQRCIDTMSAAFKTVETVAVDENGDLAAWREIFRTASARETWQVHGAWIAAEKPTFSPAIAERFAYAKSVTEAEANAARQRQTVLRSRLRERIGSDGVLCIPTAPGPAPMLDAAGNEVEAFRQRAQRLTAVAGLAGLPELTIPGLEVDGAPLGLSLIGPPGSDLALLKLARDVLAKQGKTRCG